MAQIKDKSEDTQQGDIYALYYQQRIPGNPVWVGEKVGQTETKSVKELDGNVIFGEESLKTGGKGDGKVFHGGTPFVRNSSIAFMETTLYYYKVGKIARGPTYFSHLQAQRSFQKCGDVFYVSSSRCW